MRTTTVHVCDFCGKRVIRDGAPRAGDYPFMPVSLYVIGDASRDEKLDLCDLCLTTLLDFVKLHRHREEVSQ